MRSLIYSVILVSPCLAADLYVSPSGSDDASGDINTPLQSIQAAVDAATAGTTIYLRKGTYSPSTNIQIGKSGSPGKAYVLRAYEGEKVVIDGEDLPGYVARIPCVSFLYLPCLSDAASYLHQHPC